MGAFKTADIWAVSHASVCQLRLGDIDFKQNSLRVVGKGDKVRLVYMDPEVGRELTQYLQDFGSIADFEDNEPLFVSQRGTEAGQMLDRNGLGKLIKRLGRSAKLKNVRISPHTLRHTYAVESLRNGCNNFALQQSLGHSSLAMTRRYVSLVDADLQNQHRTSSPLSALRRRKGK